MSTAEPVGELPAGVSPLGIKLVCVLGVVGVLLVGVGWLTTTSGETPLVDGVVLVFLLLQLVVYYGLWTVRRWGWYGGVLLEDIGLVGAALAGDIVLALVQGVVLFVVARHSDHYLG